MNYIQAVSKVRERGQLTVPQEVRKALNWPEDEVMVKIVTIQDGFRVEKLPISHPQHPKKKLTKKEWDKIYKDMEAFSKTGKQDIKLTDFLRHDRDTHF
ncbi:AbrB/MazE/SpoVT family DNA-binding domain-containing protein [Patescibacteria group bacterium]|nr:AbrB/MazE/SpoVT family DNA-binding domain-containing protein [Patescibacteria group bacterium]